MICYDSVLQNVTAALFQNATQIYNKMRQAFYYKMRHLLQTATVLLQNAAVITKCYVYCKLRQYISLWHHKKSFPKIMLTDREDVGTKEVVDRI